MQNRLFFACANILLLICACYRTEAAAEIEVARVQKIASFLPPHASGVGQPATNRAAWEKLAALPSFKNWLDQSRPTLLEPLPNSSDELFLEYSRNGNRTRWQDVESVRRGRLSSIALAECLEHTGEYVPALQKAVAEICAERTWVFPAHDGSLENFNEKKVTIDLGSSAVAWDLATVDFLLAHELSSATRKLIQDNLQRRIFQPFRDMVEGRRNEDGWLRRSNNWNAVCFANVTGAALAALGSPQERAWFIASTEYYIHFFLNGFTPDGYCSEGLGYWNYGFGHFILLSETVRQTTSGHIDLMADPIARAPALFSRRVEILNGIYPSIADSRPGTQPDPVLDAYICRRFGLSPCATSDSIFRAPTGRLSSSALLSFLPDELPRIPGKPGNSESPLRSWFPDGGVLICRPSTNAKTPFAVSLKGGHNGEQHNHNDVGSYSVVVGKTMVVADPGGEVYTSRTFSSRRYDSDVLSSFGHDVPVVAGQLQRTGAKAKAVVLRTDFTDTQDTLTLDLKSAYAVTNLNKLERTFVFRRDDSSLSVRDEVEFSKAESFETALVTWGERKEISANEFLITDGADTVRVKIDSGGRPFIINQKQLEADVPTPKKATRFGIALKEPVTKASIVLQFSPEAVKK